MSTFWIFVLAAGCLILGTFLANLRRENLSEDKRKFASGSSVFLFLIGTSALGIVLERLFR